MTTAAPRPSTRVVIVNWRQPELTLRAAQSLLPQLRDSDELIVVDNGSGDGSAEFLRRYGLTVVESQENRGFGAGVNAGAAGMSQDVLVLLNNDAVARPSFLDNLTRPLDPATRPRLGATTALLLLTGTWRHAQPHEVALTAADGARWTRLTQADSEVGLKGTVLVNSTGNVLDSSGNGQDRSWLTPFDELAESPEVFGICGGACAIRADVWHQLGGFREDLFMYYEDTDLSWRLHEHGYQIEFVAEAVADHDHAASSDSHSEMFTMVNARNRLIVAAAHASTLTLLRALARTGLRTARAGFRGPVATGLAQALRAIPRERARRRRARTSRPAS